MSGFAHHLAFVALLACGSAAVAQDPAPAAAVPAAAAPVAATPSPDRASLVAAWERTISRDAKLARTGPDRYTIEADEIGYRGPLSINAVLVREQPASGAGFSHVGVVDFALDELPAGRANSHAVMVWRSGAQQFYFDAARGWRASDELAQEMTQAFDSSGLGLLAAAGGSGLIFLLPLAVLGLIVWLGMRNSRRARNLFDETRGLNDEARRDLERNRALQDEQMQILRRSIALNEDSNRLLREIAEALRTPR
jgi:hypothetical protein